MNDLNACVRHKNIDTAKFCDGTIHPRVDGLFISDIHHDTDGTTTRLDDFGDDQLRGCWVKVGNNDSGPLIG